MIRTEFIRWEISVTEQSHKEDKLSRIISFAARPTYAKARIKYNQLNIAQERFVNGLAAYNEIDDAKNEFQYKEVDLPSTYYEWRYSLSDKKLIRFWLDKLQTNIDTFAHKVVDSITQFPELIVKSPIVKSNYIRMIGIESVKVINGISAPKPTIYDEMLEIDATNNSKGVPELVAAELVKDVFEPNHFEEFARHNYVTINNGKTYRIPRKTHGLIEVWDEHGNPECSLCIVFRDPGLPPSDEVVMKYLLVKHDINMLWNVANRFHQKPRTRLCN